MIRQPLSLFIWKNKNQEDGEVLQSLIHQDGHIDAALDAAALEGAETAGISEVPVGEGIAAGSFPLKFCHRRDEGFSLFDIIR